MRIQDYDSVCNVKSPADIEAALSKRHGAGRNAFWLSHGTEPFPAINIMVKGDLSLTFITFRKRGILVFHRLAGCRT
jgi:hypothetical protein